MSEQVLFLQLHSEIS